MERFARVEIWATRLVKTATHFGEAKYDERDDKGTGDESDEAVSADEGVNFRRKTKDAGADDAVDRDRDQVPATYATDQVRLRLVLHEKLITKSV